MLTTVTDVMLAVVSFLDAIGAMPYIQAVLFVAAVVAVVRIIRSGN